jgi:hypothetical protein
LIALTAGSTARLTRFNSRAKICTLGGQRHSFSTTPHFWLYLPNAEMTLDLEVNEVEVKVLTSLASVIWGTGGRHSETRHWEVQGGYQGDHEGLGEMSIGVADDEEEKVGKN